MHTALYSCFSAPYSLSKTIEFHFAGAAVSTLRSSDVFTTLSSATDNYIVRQKAAHDLMEASDYLTENVQRFTLTGDVKYLNQYFEEANVSKRRDQALITMSENHADENLIRQLQEALNGREKTNIRICRTLSGPNLRRKAKTLMKTANSR